MEEEGRAQAAERKENKGRQSLSRFEVSAGDRPLGFLGVSLVLLTVAEVVKDVESAALKAKNEKSSANPEQKRFVEEFPGKNEGSEDKKVLRPLSRPHRLQDCPDFHRRFESLYKKHPKRATVFEF
jgi:hypothetical protein